MSSVVRRGSIQVDASRAADKIREHLLAEPAAWLAEVVRAAKLQGACRIDLAWDADDLWVAFDGAPWPARAVAELETCVVADGRVPRAARLVAVGVFAALGHEALRVDVAARTDDGAVASRRYHRGDKGRVERGDAPPETIARLGADKAFVLHVRRGPSLSVITRFFSRRAPPEVALLAERLTSSAVSVFVDGEPLARAGARLALLGVDAAHEGLLVRLELCASSAHPPNVELVELGVVLARVPWPESWLTRACDGAFVPLRVVVAGDSLPTNVSRSKLREDVFEGCIGVARSALAPLIDAAREAISKGDGAGRRAVEDAVGELAHARVMAEREGVLHADILLAELTEGVADLPLLADGTGAPRSLRVLAPERRLVVHAGKSPLDARFAPVAANLLWQRRDRRIDRLLTGLSSELYREELEEGIRLAELARVDAPPAFGPAAPREPSLGASIRDARSGLTLDFALRAEGPARVRLWVHGRPFLEVGSQMKLPPVDADVAWEGVVEADISYRSLAAPSAIGRVEHAVREAVLGHLVAHGQRLAATHAPALRAWSAATPETWVAHGVASIPIWPTLGGAPKSTTSAVKSTRADGGFRWVPPGTPVPPRLPDAPVFVLSDADRAAFRAHLRLTALAVDYRPYLSRPPHNDAFARACLEGAFPGVPIAKVARAEGLHAVLSSQAIVMYLHRGVIIGTESVPGYVSFALESDAFLPAAGSLRPLSDEERERGALAAMDALLGKGAFDLGARPDLLDAVRALAPMHLIARSSHAKLASLPLFAIVEEGVEARASANDIAARFPTGVIGYEPEKRPAGAAYVRTDPASVGLLRSLLRRSVQRIGLASVVAAPPPEPRPSPSSKVASQPRDATAEAIAELLSMGPPAAAAVPIPSERPPHAPLARVDIEALRGAPPLVSSSVSSSSEQRAASSEQRGANALRALFTRAEDGAVDARALAALAQVDRGALGRFRVVVDASPREARDPPLVVKAPNVTVFALHPVVRVLVARGDAANLLAAIHAGLASRESIAAIAALIEALEPAHPDRGPRVRASSTR